MHRRPLCLFVTFLLLAVGAPGAAADNEKQSAPPSWHLAKADGSDFVLADRIGEKTYLVLFWATWCPYCKAVMPHIESLVLEHGMENFEVLAITIGEDGDPAAFLEEHGYDFTLLPDGDEVAAQYGIRGTPGVLIINRDGEIAFDLREQRRQELDSSGMSRRQIAARRAPFWAAQIRTALDESLSPR